MISGRLGKIREGRILARNPCLKQGFRANSHSHQKIHTERGSRHVHTCCSFSRLMFLVGPRAPAIAIAASHCLRSLWVSRPDVDQLTADISSFRLEIARAHRLLEQTNSALESCFREAEVQRFLLKLSGVVEVILAVVLGYLLLRRPRPVVVAERDNEPEALQDLNDTSHLSASSPPTSPQAVTLGSRGPVTPSELRRLKSSVMALLMRTLDIREPQIIRHYPNDDNGFLWAHRVLLEKAGPGIWIGLRPDGDLERIDLNVVVHIALNISRSPGPVCLRLRPTDSR